MGQVPQVQWAQEAGVIEMRGSSGFHYHTSEPAEATPISEYKGKAGTIYLQRSGSASENDPAYEVWFEDFCIIGAGETELGALKDAVMHVADIGNLVASAMGQLSPSLTGEESQLVIGAIPLQALPDRGDK
jgi:hypothetical protein